MVIKLKPSEKRAKFLRKLERKPFIRDIIFFLRRINNIGKKQGLLISEKYSAIYFPIQKVANTSIQKSLEKEFRSIKINKLKEFNLKKYFKFAFVRNPYDRLVSCYGNKVNNPSNSTLLTTHSKKIKEGMPFKEFVREISKIPDKKSDNHIKSQYYFIQDKNRNLVPDFIGKFENLEEDYRKICNKIGIKNPPKLPHKKRSKRKKDYRDYYDEETKRLVYERYKKDFELFGYSKEF